MRLPLEVLNLYPPLDGTLPGLLASRARQVPHRERLRFAGQCWSYAEFHAAVGRVAAVLHQRGVHGGSRVAVVSANHPGVAFLFPALAHLGAVMVPANPELGVDELRYVLEHAEIGGVVAAGRLSGQGAPGLRGLRESAVAFAFRKR